MGEHPLLDVTGLSAGYGSVAVVHDVSLSVAPGEIIALLGPNGAGKTTTIMALAGILPPQSGDLKFLGTALRGPIHQRSRRGIAVIPEERSIFRQLTTATNLKLGRGPTDKALDLFPELRPHLGRKAGLLSGGQQQMLTLARALASEPKLLIIDELSLGLAPLLVRRLLDAIVAASERGIGILLVEQHARMALAIADRGYVMRRGRVDIEGDGCDLLRRFEEIERSYMHDRGSLSSDQG